MDNKAPSPNGYNALVSNKQATDEGASSKVVSCSNAQRLSKAQFVACSNAYYSFSATVCWDEGMKDFSSI
jgi:hypothetical protein